ncbi:MAG: GNAT family N-acetyltransferase [Hyphomonadaceae bacterium]|nr:GNAT family N-acetyltransferase [Hyphomonadaceae bacterium]
MSLTIRPCTSADAAMLSLIAQATFLETFADFLDGDDLHAHCRTKLGEDAHAKWLAQPDARLWLALPAPGQGPVGYAGLAPPDLPIPTHPDDIELKRIYVLSRFHGAKVGPALIETAIAEARAMGRARLLLGVHSENARAIAFYRRSGFTNAGVRKFLVGATLHDDLVMAKDLTKTLD